MSLSGYEKKALAEVEDHKRNDTNKPVQNVVPRSVRKYGRGAVDAAKGNPAIGKATDAGARALQLAADGSAKFMTRSAQLSTSEDRVLRAYSMRRHQVDTLSDIRELDLQAIDKVANFRRLHYFYASGAAAEGAAAGLVLTAGQLAAVLGGVAAVGAGAAPGLGAVAAAMGVDTAVTLTACSRVVAHTALYYGYDPSQPAEEVFMMQTIGLGVATTSSGKAVAYQQLAALAQGLARNAAWKELNKQTLTKVAQKFAESFSQKLTKKKLGQAVPLAAIGIGAALNFKILSDVSDAAYWAYRERYLREKAGEYRNAIDVDEVPVINDAIDVIDVPELLRDVARNQTD